MGRRVDGDDIVVKSFVKNAKKRLSDRQGAGFDPSPTPSTGTASIGTVNRMPQTTGTPAQSLSTVNRMPQTTGTPAMSIGTVNRMPQTTEPSPAWIGTPNQTTQSTNLLGVSRPGGKPVVPGTGASVKSKAEIIKNAILAAVANNDAKALAAIGGMSVEQAQANIDAAKGLSKTDTAQQTDTQGFGFDRGEQTDTTPQPGDTLEIYTTPKPGDTPKPDPATPQPGDTPKPDDTLEIDTTPKPGDTPPTDETPKPGDAPENGISIKETPGDQSTEQRQRDTGEGTQTGTLPDAIKSTFSEVSKEIAAEAGELAKAGNDLISTLNSFYSDLFDMIGARRKDLIAQHEKDRREIDPETQMALDDLEQSVKKSLDRVREEANRRGVLDSGIYYADAGGVEQEGVRQRGYIQNTRLKGLRDRLSTALDSMFDRELGVRMDQGQRTYDARQKIIDLGVNARREGRMRLDDLRNMGLQWTRDDTLRKEQWGREDAQRKEERGWALQDRQSDRDYADKAWYREAEYKDKIMKLQRDWQAADENSRRAYEQGNIEEGRRWEAEQNRIKRDWDATEAEKNREYDKWRINQQAAQSALKNTTSSSANKTQAKNEVTSWILDLKNQGVSRDGAIERIKADLGKLGKFLTYEEALKLVDGIFGKATTP